MEVTRVFCEVDDFTQTLEWPSSQALLPAPTQCRDRSTDLSPSEMMTILILFHRSDGYRNFKGYYTHYGSRYMKPEFPNLVSYSRFIQLLPRLFWPLLGYLRRRKGSCRGLNLVDSTPLKVCHNRRISRHRVFRGMAARGKTSMGWFFGLKPHLVIHETGDLLGLALTPGNTDDRDPVPQITQGIWGKLFGDKGYLSQRLFEILRQQGIQLSTSLKKNMKPRLLSLFDKLLLRKRCLIESVFDYLKNIAHLEHSRHRSPLNALIHLVAGLIAYTYFEKRPAPRLSEQELEIIRTIKKQVPLLLC